MTHFYAFTGNPVAERHGPARFRGPRRKTVACVEVRTMNRRSVAGRAGIPHGRRGGFPEAPGGRPPPAGTSACGPRAGPPEAP